MKESKIYFISGLGADKRVFTNLTVDHSFQHHIDWEIPFVNEPLKHYCERLVNQIDKNSEVILIGVSFGGIIAQEIAKIISVKKIIILSSIKSEKELDWKLKVVSKLKLHKLFPASILLFLNKLTANYYFGIKSKEERHLLKKIIDDTNPLFMVWAIDCIMKWKNDTGIIPLHIHGTQDKIFPILNIDMCIPIEKGGHFMVFNRSKEVSLLINDFIR